MHLYLFLLMAAISLCADVNVASNRSRSTFVTSTTSNEQYIPAHRFLRDSTEANEEVFLPRVFWRQHGGETKTRGQTVRINLALTKPFQSGNGVAKTLLWNLGGREILWMTPSFLSLYEVAKSAEHFKLENMGQACGTDKDLVCPDDHATMLESEPIYSWLSQANR